MSQLFAWGGQSIGVSASFQRTTRTDLLSDGLVGSPCRPRDSQETSPAPQFKIIFGAQLFFIVQLSHPYMTSGKTIALTRQNFVGKGPLWGPLSFPDFSLTFSRDSPRGIDPNFSYFFQRIVLSATLSLCHKINSSFFPFKPLLLYIC